MQAARALFDAAKAGKIDEINALLTAGANPNALKNNVPAIWYATNNGYEAAAMILLEVTDPRLLSIKHSSDGTTLLHEAAIMGTYNLVKAAIAKGADPNILSEHDSLAITEAIGSRQELMAMFLLEVTDSRLLKYKDPSDDATMLHTAANRGMKNFIKAAVARGADPDDLDENNVPAIWYAVANHYESVAMVLLEMTDPQLLSNKHSSDGNTMLHEAAKKEMWAFIKAAIAKGSDPYAKNLSGQSLIDLMKLSRLEREEKRALVGDAMHEHAWAKRGALVMLRGRLRQAWEAECDAEEAAAAAQAPSASPDA
jgi:ankyrin repeat protein